MIRVTRHGWREILIGTLLLAAIAWAFAWFLWWPLALAVGPVWVWLIAFFRDPERTIPGEQHAMVSPADGKVSDVMEVHSDLLGGPAIRIGIFLSVFNVHVNRAPCDGRVIAVNYKKGKFINALHHNEASDQNESNTIVLAEAHGDRPIAVVKQIVGLIARRIICTSGVGDTVRRGQRIGMIKFGSRTELLIPTWLAPEVRVKPGDVVQGAKDIIAVLGHAIHTERPAAGADTTPPPEPSPTPAPHA